MKNRDLFSLESALSNGCTSKHWPLVKAWDRMLGAVRAVTEPMRARLTATDALRAYQRAVNRVSANPERETPEIISEKLRAIDREHGQALADAAEIRQLEQDILDDETDIVLTAIDERLLHDNGVLRIEPSAFFALSRLGLVKE